MAAGIFYKLVEATSGNSLIFLAPGGTDFALSRSIWESELPYVKDIWMTDQITTREDLTIEGTVKCGTGFPYATITAAMEAIRGVMPSTYSSGWTLDEGDWDGSSWTTNANYPVHIGASGTKVTPPLIRFKYPGGEPYTNGELKVTISLKRGITF